MHVELRSHPFFGSGRLAIDLAINIDRAYLKRWYYWGYQ